jgi:hypothetical protein
MTDIRQDLEKLGDALAEVAREASYVAIGAGVLGFHRAQVRRQEMIGARARRVAGIADGAGPFTSGREQVAKRANDFDATVVQVIKLLDSTLEPLFQRLPEGMQAIVQQARQTRDELRTRVFGGPA